MARRDAVIVVRHREAQDADAELGQPAAEVDLAVPLGVPVGQQNDGRPGCPGAEKARVHEIVVRPRRRNLARKREHLPSGSAVLGRMQHVVVGGRRGKPFVAMRQRFFNPRVQKSARIGLVGPAADMFEAPFKGIDPPIVIGGPPGVLVAPNFLFQPGHNAGPNPVALAFRRASACIYNARLKAGSTKLCRRISNIGACGRPVKPTCRDGGGILVRR